MRRALRHVIRLRADRHLQLGEILDVPAQRAPVGDRQAERAAMPGRESLGFDREGDPARRLGIGNRDRGPVSAIRLIAVTWVAWEAGRAASKSSLSRTPRPTLPSAMR